MKLETTVRLTTTSGKMVEDPRDAVIVYGCLARGDNKTVIVGAEKTMTFTRVSKDCTAYTIEELLTALDPDLETVQDWLDGADERAKAKEAAKAKAAQEAAEAKAKATAATADVSDDEEDEGLAVAASAAPKAGGVEKKAAGAEKKVAGAAKKAAVAAG